MSDIDELSEAEFAELQLRTALDEMRRIGGENDCVVVTTEAVRRQMAEWGICHFAKDAWLWNGYEVIADANIPTDMLYVVPRNSLPVREVTQ